MSISEIIWLVYAGLVTTISFIHLIQLDHWSIRIWDFPHLQLAVLATVGLAVSPFVISSLSVPTAIGLAGLVGATGYQSWLIYPYTRLHRRQVIRMRARRLPTGEAEQAAQNTIRLLIANVYMENTQMPQVCRLVSQYKPDVVLVLEGNLAWRNALQEIEPNYPYQVLCPLENTYGMLLYSRLPIRYHELRFQIKNDIPSIYAQLELPSGQVVHFYGLHPMPPTPTEHYRSTERDAELLLVGKEVRQQTEPVIVAGDMNDVAWSHTTRLFQRISGLLDPRVGRGLYSTFHARYFFMRWPLDHVFVSHHFRLRSIRRLPNCGSDHFPIVTTLTYAPDPRRKARIPQPEDDDLDEAREIINEAN